ncbi:hypothetical protein Tco_0659718 [Tanacetum coccineum]
MVFSVASHKEEGSSSTPIPPIPVFDLREEIVETIGDFTFEKRARLCYKTFLAILLKNYGLCIYRPFTTRWLTTTRKGTYVLVMFRRPGYFLPPRAVNDDGSAMYHAPYCFIHKWYKVNPSSRRQDSILRNVEPIETLDDDDDARSLWSSDDDEHFDPFEDDPTHIDARWSP